jgi:hypothetical protein
VSGVRRSTRPVVGAEAENGFRRIETAACARSVASVEREQIAVTCGDCGREVAGTILFVFGRYEYLCERCVPEQVRTRPPVPCEGCGREIVLVAPDRRFRHLVCSPECQRWLRDVLRHVEHEPKECEAPDCFNVFVPFRSDQKFCEAACRVRAWRERAA